MSNVAEANPEPEDPLRDKRRGQRLQKALAEAGVGSRRACERLIEEGRVRVEGRVIDTLPAWVDRQRDRIEVDGKPVRAPSRTGHTYLMVNKPRKVICTNRDPEGRTRIIDLVPRDRRLFCVGRLDAESTGLVLLTDDGELANRLMHPSFGVVKTYQVTIRGRLTDEQIDKLRRGIFLAEEKTGRAVKAKAAAVTLRGRQRDSTRLIIRLREGRNREIRRMLARFGHKVKRLRRVGLGPLELKGVGSGRWRELTRAEVRKLRDAGRRSEARSGSSS